MNNRFFLAALLMVMFCFVLSVSVSAEEAAPKVKKSETKEAEQNFSPKVLKWLDLTLTFESKEYEFDTVVAICKKITGASLRFAEGMEKTEMPKVTYKAYRFTLRKVLNDLTEGTSFEWTAKGDRIIVQKRSY